MKWWFHVAATAMLTFVAVHRKRGVDATDRIEIFPRFTGTMIHDRCAPYWRYGQATHTVCNAHSAERGTMRKRLVGHDEWLFSRGPLVVVP